MCPFIGVLALVVLIGAIYIELTTCKHTFVTDGCENDVWYEKCIHCECRIKDEGA